MYNIAYTINGKTTAVHVIKNFVTRMVTPAHLNQQGFECIHITDDTHGVTMEIKREHSWTVRFLNATEPYTTYNDYQHDVFNMLNIFLAGGYSFLAKTA